MAYFSILCCQFTNFSISWLILSTREASDMSMNSDSVYICRPPMIDSSTS